MTKVEIQYEMLVKTYSNFGHDAQPCAMTANVQLGPGHHRVSGSTAKIRRSISDSYNVKRLLFFSPIKLSMSGKKEGNFF